MTSRSHTPAEVEITPRNRSHELAPALAVDWMDNHPFKTTWFNAMSMTFPLGEKFFVDSVRHFADQIDDPKLREEIRGFCGQEGFHRREHDRYNRALCELRGYDHDRIENRLKKNIAQSYRWFSPLERLAVTAALEHITAIMAESSLSEGTHMDLVADREMRALWDWHAVEEMEHKAVAFDVFRAVGGTEKMRKKAMRQSTAFLTFDIMYGAIHMLHRDGKLWNFRVWKEGWKFLFFKGGVLRRIWPAYKEYYQEGFHPWHRDTRPLLDDWKHAQQPVTV